MLEVAINDRCMLIEEYIDGLRPNSTIYHYKQQAIVSPRGGELGFEVLIDGAMHDQHTDFLKIHGDLRFASSTIFLFQRLKVYFSYLAEKAEGTQYIFVNIERSNLCDIALIATVIDAVRVAKKHGVVLVVEVTERNHCRDCRRVGEGLEMLSRAGVLLAADDYDIYGGDFRSEEVDAGLYEFIKVNAPLTAREGDFLKRVCEQRDEKFIIERIEGTDCLSLDPNLAPFIWGYQGYLFDVGKRMVL